MNYRNHKYNYVYTTPTESSNFGASHKEKQKPNQVRPHL